LPQSSSSGLTLRDVFTDCLRQYRRSRARVGRLPANVLRKEVTETGAPIAGGPPPASTVRDADYVADFEHAGARALGRPTWKKRLELFHVYYCRGKDYRDASRALGVSLGTFDYWMHEVRRAVGRECLRVALWPPHRYFHLEKGRPAGNRRGVGERRATVGATVGAAGGPTR
jgi:DNA-directed RNA polymerase specialized sigma24 family protein